MPRASWDFIGNLPVLVPPLDEQRAIAAFLDRETARIDALIEKKRRQIELLQEKRAALISHAVTKGLGPTAPMKDSGIDWLGHIPAHWAVIRIGLLCAVGNGSTPSREKPEYWSDESYPWLTSAKINEEIIEAADEAVSELAFRECHLPWVRQESVLLAITGEGQTRGRAALLRCASTISQHLAYITPRNIRLDAPFLWRALQSQYKWLRMESSGTGSTRAALTCEFIRTIKIPLPPPGEQGSIVAYVDRATDKINLLVAKVSLSIDRLREYRTALISAAVTGKLDVRQEVA
jgi:type I restriction enzyme S subunit